MSARRLLISAVSWDWVTNEVVCELLKSVELVSTELLRSISEDLTNPEFVVSLDD